MPTVFRVVRLRIVTRIKAPIAPKAISFCFAIQLIDVIRLHMAAPSLSIGVIYRQSA
jgi:hypothetical protein